jgi:hypothetical protein
MTEQKDFESRLRDALRADGEGAQTDPRALGKIRGRLAQDPQRRPVKRVIVYGVMATAAACTAAVLVVPLFTSPASLDSASAPEQAASQGKTQYQAATPSQTQSPDESTQRSADQAPPVLGELTVGKDLRLTLTYSPNGTDTASVTLSAYKASGALAGSASVGAPNQWRPAAEAEPKLCEFRVTQPVNRPATVRVRLAQGSGCSALYTYELDGETLKQK